LNKKAADSPAQTRQSCGKAVRRLENWAAFYTPGVERSLSTEAALTAPASGMDIEKSFISIEQL
jgi:hypothetical protein